MVNALIDPKKKEEVKRALEKGDISGIFRPKKIIEKSAPAVEAANTKYASLSKEELNEKLFTWATAPNVYEVERLLRAGADVDARYGQEWTVLMVVAADGYKDVVKLLIDWKADVNAKSREGWTALMFAARSGHKEVVQILIGAKADVNAKNCDGKSVLEFASELEGDEIFELLEKNGAKA